NKNTGIAKLNGSGAGLAIPLTQPSAEIAITQPARSSQPFTESFISTRPVAESVAGKPAIVSAEPVITAPVAVPVQNLQNNFVRINKSTTATAVVKNEPLIYPASPVIADNNSNNIATPPVARENK